MKNQPNKATVKDGLPTAEEVIDKYPVEKDFWSFVISRESAIQAMQEYSDQQNAELTQSVSQLQRLLDAQMAINYELRERVKELESWKNPTRGLINEIENRHTTADLMHIYSEESGVKEKDMAGYEAGFYDGMTFFRRRLNEELK